MTNDEKLKEMQRKKWKVTLGENEYRVKIIAILNCGKYPVVGLLTALKSPHNEFIRQYAIERNDDGIWEQLKEVSQYADWPMDCWAEFWDNYPTVDSCKGCFAGTDAEGHPYKWTGNTTSRTQIVPGPRNVRFSHAIRIDKEN